MNGDGTVTDYDTGLQWEQKDDTHNASDPDDPHDADNDDYAWSASGAAPDGAAFTAFLGPLNNADLLRAPSDRSRSDFHRTAAPLDS
jgi:hypothetical protein